MRTEQMNNVMLDLETMGIGPNAAIIAIGAVEFDPESDDLGRRFYRVVDLESSVQNGGVIDAATGIWWLQQIAEASGEFQRNTVPIAVALQEFSQWIRGETFVWGNGAAFDNVILASAYRNVGMTVPWDFWADRCYRTVKALHPEIKLVRNGTFHNALDDAETQAEHLVRILRSRAS